jgi:hypothetical protein
MERVNWKLILLSWLQVIGFTVMEWKLTYYLNNVNKIQQRSPVGFLRHTLGSNITLHAATPK